MPRFRDVLKNRNFFLLWLGQLVSNFGDRLNQMALVALVYQRAPGSELALATLISFTIIPVFIVGPIAGVWIDRLSRKKVMIISDVLRGVIVLFIPFFIGIKATPLVYLSIFLVFSIARFFIPSKMAMIPDLVSKEELLMANTLQDTTRMIGNVVGLVAAGVIVNIRYIGAIGGFYIDAATFFFSAILVVLIRKQEPAKSVKEDLVVTGEAIRSSLRRGVINEFKEGMRQLIKYKNMRFAMSVFALLMAGTGAVSCVIIIFVQSAFGTSTRDIGFLGMFFAAGLFFGAILYGKIGQRFDKKNAIYWSFMASGAVVVAFTIAVAHYPYLPVAGGLVALLGIAISPVMASMNTLTHETIPDEVRGRIFSSLEVVIHLSFLVFMFIAAYGAKWCGRYWVLMGVGAVFVLCGGWGAIRHERTISRS